jgi:hypothetical protein
LASLLETKAQVGAWAHAVCFQALVGGSEKQEFDFLAKGGWFALAECVFSADSYFAFMLRLHSALFFDILSAFHGFLGVDSDFILQFRGEFRAIF